MTLRLVFMGTPDFAVPALAALHHAGHTVAAVYTRAPKPARRGLNMQESPVHNYASAHAMPVYHPPTLKTPDEQARLAALAPDLVVVVAYGLLLPPAVLILPRHGCLNLHASLLPRWRGAAPVQRAVMAGDAQTGVMVMRMDAGLDTGPVALSAALPIAPDDVAGDLHDMLAARGARLMVEACEMLEHGTLGFVPQSEGGVTYARKIEKAETRIDWSKPARDVHNHMRALSPSPGAWFLFQGERLKVVRSTCVEGSGEPGRVLTDQLVIACADGAVQVLTLQRAGKQPMSAADVLRGFPIPSGAVLG